MSHRAYSASWLAMAVVAVAVAAAAGSWWYQFAATRRTHEFLGAEAALLVAQAPTAELFFLDAESAAAPGMDSVAIGGAPRRIVGRSNLHRQRGFVHFRHALRQDESYVEYRTAMQMPPDLEWAYVLQFTDGDRRAMLVIDRDHRVVALSDLSRAAVCTDAMRRGMARFLSESLSGKSAPTAP